MNDDTAALQQKLDKLLTNIDGLTFEWANEPLDEFALGYRRGYDDCRQRIQALAGKK